MFRDRFSKLIDLLESEGLVAPELIEELRRHVLHSEDRMPVETLAGLLADNEQTTRFAIEYLRS